MKNIEDQVRKQCMQKKGIPSLILAGIFNEELRNLVAILKGSIRCQ